MYLYNNIIINNDEIIPTLLNHKAREGKTSAANEFL